MEQDTASPTLTEPLQNEADLRAALASRDAVMNRMMDHLDLINRTCAALCEAVKSLQVRVLGPQD